MIRNFILVLVVAIVGCMGEGRAATIFSKSASSAGDWSDFRSWIGGVVPGSNDDVVIQGDVWVDGNFTCKSLSLSGYVLQFDDNQRLTVTGNVTFSSGSMIMARNTILTVGGHWIDFGIGSDIRFSPGSTSISSLNSNQTGTVVFNGTTTQYINVSSISPSQTVQSAHALYFAFLVIDGADVQFFTSYLKTVKVYYTFTVNVGKNFTFDFVNPTSASSGVQTLSFGGDVQNNGTFTYSYARTIGIPPINFNGTAPYQSGKSSFYLNGSGSFYNVYAEIDAGVLYTINSDITLKMINILGTLIIDGCTLIISKEVAGTNCFISLLGSGRLDLNDNGNGQIPTLQIGSNKDVALLSGRTDNAYLNVDSGCTITADANAVVRFQGAVQQAIYNDVSNAPLSFPNLVMNNSSATGVYLYDKDLWVTGSATFTDGRLYTSENYKLSFRESATSSVPAGLTSGSYVVGWVEKRSIPVGVTFEFPVGNDGGTGNQFYAPIRFTTTSNASTSDLLLVTYRRISPHISTANDNGNLAPYVITSKDAVLDHVSNAEYWIMDRTNGSVRGRIAMSYDHIRSMGVTDPSTLRVCHWDGSNWDNSGNSSVAPLSASPHSGYITSNIITSFSPFTLGSTTPASINPLPVVFLAFNAEKQTNNALLNWYVATDGEGYSYEVQRSVDGVHFETISSGVQQLYDRAKGFSFTDTQVENLYASVVYYRIKLTDDKQQTIYSKIEPVWYNPQASLSMNAYPNPFDNEVKLEFLLAKSTLTTIRIVDILGREVGRQVVKGTEGWNQVSLPGKDLATGTYVVELHTASGTSIQKLIKQ